MELRGRRTLLRPVTPADRPELARIQATPEVARFWGAEFDPDEGTPDEPVHDFTIVLDGRVVGFIQAYERSDPDYRHAGLDLFLDPAVHGQGLGSDAVRTLARWLIDVRGHHRLVIDPRADNERAIRTYARVGFRPVGILRRYERGDDGVWRDALLMDLLADELSGP